MRFLTAIFVFIMTCLVWPAKTIGATSNGTGGGIHGYDNVTSSVVGHDPPTLEISTELERGNYIESSMALTSLPAIPVTNGLVVYRQIATASGPPRQSLNLYLHCCPSSNRPYLPGGGAKAA